jgi:hypothetical protein
MSERSAIGDHIPAAGYTAFSGNETPRIKEIAMRGKASR